MEQQNLYQAPRNRLMCQHTYKHKQRGRKSIKQAKNVQENWKQTDRNHEWEG